MTGWPRRIGRYRGPVVSHGEMRRTLQARPLDDVWRSTLGWSRTLAPFWLDRFATVAAVRDDRRTLLSGAATTAFDRMDDWWHGRVRLVKARRNEIDSAISLVRNTALHGDVAYLVQAPVARHAAGALRTCLQVAAGSYDREQLPLLAAGLVYRWACCRTLFPGDPDTLLQHVPPGLIRRGSWDDPDHTDNDHLVYDRPADAFGLRREADAVYAEAARIWGSFDDPLPWALPDDVWTRPYDGTYQAMHYGEQRAFHQR